MGAAGGRYKWIKKKFEHIEAFEQGDAFVVYIRGTLYGVNLKNISFSDVRFIDRFTIKDGRIIQQDVWNDLAESGVLARDN